MAQSSFVAGVSGRYATALFELAEEQDKLDEVEGHLGRLREALSESDDLRAVVRSPIYGREAQGRAMAAVCDAIDVGAPTKSLIGLMASKRRLFALPEVIRDFTALLEAKRGVVRAEVTAAAPLSDEQRRNLEETLKQATGSDVALDVTVDEALIGGLVVKVGSKMIDTSIRSKLMHMQTAMKEARL